MAIDEVHDRAALQAVLECPRLAGAFHPMCLRYWHGGEQSLLASLSHRSCKLLVLLSASAASMSEAYCSALPAACLPHHGPKASRVQSTDGANRALFQHRARLLVTQ